MTRKAENEIVSTERAFARKASESNTREAFLEFLCKGSLVAAGGVFVHALEWWRRSEPDESLLSWRPDFVDAAFSGELGVSAGPFENWNSREAAEPTFCGRYVTIWRKQSPGLWRVAVDLGFRSGMRRQDSSGTIEYGAQSPSVDSWEVNSHRWNIKELERSIEAKRKEEGSEAYAAHWAVDARVYRPNSASLTGLQLREQILSDAARWRSSLAEGGEISRSGEWAYSYGSVVYSERLEAGAGTDSSAYVRVWKRCSDEQWKIVLEIIAE